MRQSDELGRARAAMTAHLAPRDAIVEPLIQDRQLDPPAQAMLPPTTTSFAYDFQRGREQFRQLGCAGCHVPMLVLESPILTVEGLPPIDLAKTMRQPGLRYDAKLGGYPVWLFSDLKRHDMGPANAPRTCSGASACATISRRGSGASPTPPPTARRARTELRLRDAGHDGEGAARATFGRWRRRTRPLRAYLMESPGACRA
jgi:hypothetical protein